MKDKPLAPQAPSGSIPLISPLLHCVAMPVLVFLRHSFGYNYLRPKKIFLASVIVTGGFAFAVWHDPALKALFPLAAFAVLASALYLVHLVSGISKLTRGDAEHDQYSGTSFLLAFVPPTKRSKCEGFIHCAAEPLLLTGIGCLIPKPFGKILVVCGIALCLKEMIRAWLSLRFDKALSDNLADAKDKMENTQSTAHQQSISTKGRTPRERFKPHSMKD
jgi:hypothetical protein